MVKSFVQINCLLDFLVFFGYYLSGFFLNSLLFPYNFIVFLAFAFFLFYCIFLLLKL